MKALEKDSTPWGHLFGVAKGLRQALEKLRLEAEAKKTAKAAEQALAPFLRLSFIF